jgi:F0F1-type ATP synthase assembly protein I
MAEPHSVLRFGRSIALFWDFVGTVLGGAAIGWFIDSRFDTEPWAMTGLLILGVVGGFVRLVRSLRRMDRLDRVG